MAVRMWGWFPGVLFCVILFASDFAPAQQITIDDISIVRKESGYAISGNVVVNSLNPAERTVVADHVTVLAEIRLENDSEFPILPDSRLSPQPKWAQTPYRIGNSFLTDKQTSGKGIQTFTLAKMDMRETPVWKKYGGADKWRASAPEKAQAHFESMIPLEYGNRPMRIRATLEQSYVPEKPGAEPAVVKHDVIKILPTLEIHAEEAKKLYPLPKPGSETPDDKKPQATKPAVPQKKVDPRVVFARRTELISLITTVEIKKPQLLKDVQKNFFKARDEYADDRTDIALQTYIAWHRKLITMVMHTPILQPEELGDIQLDYIRIAK